MAQGNIIVYQKKGTHRGNIIHQKKGTRREEHNEPYLSKYASLLENTCSMQKDKQYNQSSKLN